MTYVRDPVDTVPNEFFVFGTVLLTLKVHHIEPKHTVPNEFFAFGTVLLTLKVLHIEPKRTVPNEFFAFGTVSESDALTQDALVIMAIITEDFNTTGSLDSSVAALLNASIDGLEFDFGGKYLFY